MSEEQAPYSRIAKPSPVDVRAVWPGEARDFTPWLAENLDWLADLGLGPLTKEGVEVVIPGTGRSLDILASTDDGRLVAIENQYDRLDHDHLTRGLAYAVGHNARALVMIAEAHNPEFRAIADYLNRAYEEMDDGEGIAIFLVRMSAEQIGDSFVPRFDVVNAPNEWKAAVRTSKRATIESVDAFLESTVDGCVEPYRELIAAWRELPHASVRRNGTTVTLCLNPDGPPKRPRTFYTLEPTGNVWVSMELVAHMRGSDLALAGEAAAEALPTIVMTGAGKWWKVHGEDASALIRFVGLAQEAWNEQRNLVTVSWNNGEVR